MTSLRCIPLLLAGALLLGCPGELKVLPDQGYSRPDFPQDDTIVIGGGDTLIVPMPEGGADQAGGWDTGAAPDLPPPDLSPPDSAATPADQGPKTGGKCPCATGLWCVNNACRAPCKAPTDACKVSSNCPTAEACVETNTKGFWVCIPGSMAGQSCAGNYFCQQKHICAKVGSSSYTCLPTCSSPGAACGTTGGQCLKASGSSCMFCSKP